MSGMVVAGGAGSLSARVEDMHRCAGVLLEAGARLSAVVPVLARSAADPALAGTALVAPATFAAVQARLAAALLGPGGAVPVAVRLEALGTALRAAALAYAAAEGTARAAAREVDLTVGRLAGRLAVPLAAPVLLGAAATAAAVAGSRAAGSAGGGGGAGGAGIAGPGALGNVVEHAMAAVPGFLEGLLAPLPGSGPVWAAAAGTTWPARDLRSAAALAGAAGSVSPLLRERGPSQLDVGTPTRVAPPGGAADLLERVVTAYPAAGAQPGSVRVESVTGPDGRRAWIVAIPGTQEWSPLPGEVPFDLTANVHALAGRPTAAAGTVVGALRAAGARRGEPVLLAGHSQGGMLAAGLAASPRFRTEFTVTHVVTAGSPVAPYAVPASVHVLSLEHVDDLVPRLDGAPNPSRPRWVTVSRAATPAGAAIDLAAAHDAAGYVRSAALVDASPDPSLRRWRAGLGPFLDRPGAVASARQVVGRRPP